MGISNLARIIERKKIPVNSVTALEDRASQIVGAAIAKALGYPLRLWSSSEPNTIVVAYDLSAIDLTPYKRLSERSPGQFALRKLESSANAGQKHQISSG